MVKVRYHFLFILFILIPFSTLLGQGVIIDAIEINTSSLSGKGTLPEYSDFISNTKNPALFRTRDISNPTNKSSARSTGVSIDFIFRSINNPRHQFIAGFEAANTTTDLYELQGTFQDTIAVTSTYTSVSEHFYLRAGYNYVRAPHRKFTLMAGAVARLGIPISSKTEESISGMDLFDNEFSFFAKQSASVGLSVPFGFRFKVIKNLSMTFTSRPTFHFSGLDGTPHFMMLRGTNLAFHFKLRRGS